MLNSKQTDIVNTLVEMNRLGLKILSVDFATGEIRSNVISELPDQEAPNRNPPRPLLLEEEEYIRNGNKLEAIKSVRNRLNISLREAKDYVELHSRPAFSERLHELINARDKIGAIKLVREHNMYWDLSACKAYVEDLAFDLNIQF